jgi:uncharacterized protein with FMN-binding domain
MDRLKAIALLVALTVGGVSLAVLNGMSKANAEESPTVMVISPDGVGTAVHIADGVYVTAAHNFEGDVAVKVKALDGALHDITRVDSFENDIAFFRSDPAPGSAKVMCADAEPGTRVFHEGYPQITVFQRYDGTIASRAFSPMGIGLAGGEKYETAQVIDVDIAPGSSGGGVFLTGTYDLVGIVVATYAEDMVSPELEIAVPASTICDFKEALDAAS